MDENRGVLKLFFLTVITFGIYGLYFIHKVSVDMDTVCAGDGKHTQGLIVYILLSIVTLGIYSLIWMYGVGERINTFCIKNSLTSRCTGGSLLLWEIFGALIIVGPLVAEYKMLHGMNDICHHYNLVARGAMNGGKAININININQ